MLAAAIWMWNPDEKEGRRRRNAVIQQRRRKVDHCVGASYLDTGWETSSCMRCGRSFGWRWRRHHWSFMWTIVYVDDVFVRLALDGLVPLIIHFRVDLISVSLIIFYCRHVSFRILLPNKIHHTRLQLNPQELVMHPMIPWIMNLINLIQSHRFHIFHRGCLCLHYLLHENTMHWTLTGITSNEVVEVEWGCAIRNGLVSE